jgi:hypothetical protein
VSQRLNDEIVREIARANTAVASAPAAVAP